MDATLTTEARTDKGSRPSGRLRRAGKVPAVVYGLDAETISIAVPARELGHILASESGSNTLITLKMGEDESLALARQIQRHPTRNELLHVDFVRVRRDVAVEAEVPLHLTGEAEGVRTGGLLEQLLFALAVEAKPQDIPSAIEVDISHLEINDQLHVRDIALPPGVTVQDEPDELAAHIIVPRVVEEPVAEVAEGEEGAEGAEGEVAAEGEAGEKPAEGSEEKSE